MNHLSKLTASALALSLLASAACTGDGASDEPEYGLAGKADGVCDPAGDLCWWTKDVVAMRGIMDKRDQFALGRGVSRDVLLGMVEDLKLVNQKLTDAERAAITDVADRIAAREETATNADLMNEYQKLRAAGMDRVVGTYYATYAVQAGNSADNFSNGKSDDSADKHGHAIEGLSEGMVESLNDLRRAGVIETGYAAMLEMSGVLDIDYTIVNAKNFGELDEATGKIVPRGLSRDERVDRIITDYKIAGGIIGLVAGSEALIPVAGIGISIAHETYELFRLHAQMTFEIAAVYGWDIREGRNLYRLTTMLLSYGLLVEAGDVVASNLVVPMIVRSLAMRFGLTLPADLAAKIASRSLGNLLKFFSRKSQEKLTEQVLKHGAKGLGGQLLGWATVGLTVFVSGALDYLATQEVGEHVAVVAKRYIQDMMMEGSTHLSKPAVRDCMFQALGTIMYADGKLAPRERAYFVAMLAKPYRVTTGEAAWFNLSPDEMRRQAGVLHDIGHDGIDADSAVSCVEDHFEDQRGQYKINTLGHLYGAMQIDLQETAAERKIYDAMRDSLDGTGFFDGSDVSEYLHYLERSIDIMVQPGQLEVPTEFVEEVQSILPEDSFDFMRELDPAAEAAFNCGFAQRC